MGHNIRRRLAVLGVLLAMTGPAFPQTSAELSCKASSLRPMSSKNPLMTAAATLNLDGVHQIYLDCLIALQTNTGDLKLAVAAYIASDVMNVMSFGSDYPDADQDRFLRALKGADERKGLELRANEMYLATAYQFGIGIKPDFAEARRWYARGAAAGDTVALKALTQAALN